MRRRFLAIVGSGYHAMDAEDWESDAAFLRRVDPRATMSQNDRWVETRNGSLALLNSVYVDGKEIGALSTGR